MRDSSPSTRDLLDQFSKGMEQSCSKDTSPGQCVDVKGHSVGHVGEEKEEIEDEIVNCGV